MVDTPNFAFTKPNHLGDEYFAERSQDVEDLEEIEVESDPLSVSRGSYSLLKNQNHQMDSDNSFLPEDPFSSNQSPVKKHRPDIINPDKSSSFSIEGTNGQNEHQKPVQDLLGVGGQEFSKTNIF